MVLDSNLISHVRQDLPDQFGLDLAGHVVRHLSASVGGKKLFFTADPRR
jgi:hypothetical protein